MRTRAKKGPMTAWGLMLLLVIPAASPGPVQEGTRFVSQDDRQRWYHYHLPDGYAPENAHPAVLNFHGGGGDASRVADSTEFNVAADAYGFIAVYPQGVGEEVLGTYFGTWNGGNCCGIAAEENIDDTAFVDALLDDLEASFSVDPARIYATGISNGAMMSYRLACELSHRIAAVAPIAGMAQDLECEPGRAVPVLHIHGTADRCSLYDAGRTPKITGFCPSDGKRQLSGGCFQTVLGEILGLPVEPVCFYQPPVPTYVGAWARRNDCPRGQPTQARGTTFSCSTWGPCREESEVILCAVWGGGHTWPGAPPPRACIDNPGGEICLLFTEVLGTISDELDANALMWSFFERHTLP